MREAELYSRCLFHSAKGTEWKKHKYIKKEDGRYYYKDTGKGRSKKSKDELLEELNDIQERMRMCDEKAKEFDALIENGGSDKELYRVEAQKYRDEITRLNKERDEIASAIEDKEKTEDTVNKIKDPVGTVSKFGVKNWKTMYIGVPRFKFKHDDEDSDELYHHGIKGQKWGVRNGPPYPLKDSVKEKAYRTPGRKVRSASVNQDAGKKRKRGNAWFNALDPNLFLDYDSAKNRRNEKETPKSKSLFDSIGDRIRENKEKRAQEQEAKAKEAAKQKRLEALARGREVAKAKRLQAQEEQKKREAHEEEKRKAVASGDPEQIAKFMSELTTAEQRDAINRIDQTANIRRTAEAQAARREAENAPKPVPTKYERIMRKAKDLMAKGAEVRELTEEGIKIYNVYAAINNAFNDEKKLPRINLNPGNKEKKDGNNDSSESYDEKPKQKKDKGKPTPEPQPKEQSTSQAKEQSRPQSEERSDNTSAPKRESSEPYYTYEENARKLLTMASKLDPDDAKKAAETGARYWMTVTNGGGNYPGSSSESASNYYKDRAAENKRYNEWEEEQRRKAAERLAKKLLSSIK